MKKEISQKKPPLKRTDSVRSTDKLMMGKADDGNEIINQYKILRNLGKGNYARVKLGKDVHN